MKWFLDNASYNFHIVCQIQLNHQRAKSDEQQTKSNKQQAVINVQPVLKICNFDSKTILKVFLQLKHRQLYLKLYSLSSVKQND